MSLGRAPGKAILFGEHAVVYGRPAIAVPIHRVAARAEVREARGAARGEITLDAPDVALRSPHHRLDELHPLRRIVELALAELGLDDPPALHVRLTSTIPVAAGMGSSAAVSIAALRALASHFGKEMPLDRQSALAYEVEKIHHGNPSGIDNTVVTYGVPTYFIKGQDPRTIPLALPLTLVLGDTGIPSPTAHAVARVREAWQAEPDRFNRLFDRIAEIVDAGRTALERGDVPALGPLMDENQAVLEELDVSHEALGRLVGAGRKAGAQGAKLSGGGLGGIMIALTTPGGAGRVRRALLRAGAVVAFRTEVGR